MTNNWFLNQKTPMKTLQCVAMTGVCHPLYFSENIFPPLVLYTLWHNYLNNCKSVIYYITAILVGLYECVDGGFFLSFLCFWFYPYTDVFYCIVKNWENTTHTGIFNRHGSLYTLVWISIFFFCPWKSQTNCAHVGQPLHSIKLTYFFFQGTKYHAWYYWGGIWTHGRCHSTADVLPLDHRDRSVARGSSILHR